MPSYILLLLWIILEELLVLFKMLYKGARLVVWGQRFRNTLLFLLMLTDLWSSSCAPGTRQCFPCNFFSVFHGGDLVSSIGTVMEAWEVKSLSSSLSVVCYQALCHSRVKNLYYTDEMPFEGFMDHIPGSVSLLYLEAPSLLSGPEHLPGGSHHGKL